jgi:hypothetical protein
MWVGYPDRQRRAVFAGIGSFPSKTSSPDFLNRAICTPGQRWVDGSARWTGHGSPLLEVQQLRKACAWRRECHLLLTYIVWLQVKSGSNAGSGPLLKASFRAVCIHWTPPYNPPPTPNIIPSYSPTQSDSSTNRRSSLIKNRINFPTVPTSRPKQRHVHTYRLFHSRCLS